MKNPILITFTGAMGVGKSTAINYLHSRARRAKNVKFAQSLYDIQEFIYDLISPVYQRPKTFIKDRKLLQWLGTDWGRDTISPTLWVDLWKANVEMAMGGFSSNEVVTCDDVRFDNEAQAVRDMGGVVVRITSSRNGERIDTGAGIKNHASEAGISEKFVDFTIDNSDTEIVFIEKLDALLKTLILNQKEI